MNRSDENLFCVIIPTYNNVRTLEGIISGAKQYCKNIIVVNDGATDDTSRILQKFPLVHKIVFNKNRGKGHALRKGFSEAQKMGFEYAITIDSDGQHFPNDIPIFIEKVEKEKPTILIGARNMRADEIPRKSSFGNRFSNFWFWIETGIRLKDTQSGFRLYPLKEINKIRFYTTRFEFEIEVLVRAAWRGIKVENIPIKVLYDKDQRVSHFRPFTDFMRISLLNTILVAVTFIFIKPRELFRKLRKKGINRFFVDDILKSNDSIIKKSLSVALGVFIGIVPIWGFQTVAVLFLATFFNLNKIIAFAFSNISIPPMIPFIIYLSFKLGGFITGRPVLINLTHIEDNLNVAYLTQYISGSFVLAFFLSVVLGTGSYLILGLFKKANV